MGNQGTFGPASLPAGRLVIDMDDTIHDLNINKAPLLKLLSEIGKEEATQMKYEWMTEELMTHWGTIDSFGGAWASGANKAGTITVPVSEAYLYASGDVIRCPKDSQVNIYVSSVVQATGVLTCFTYDNSTTIDFSAGTTGANSIINVSNVHESGGGKGTIKNVVPVENYNYIQISQTPFGIIEELLHLEQRGGKEFDRQRMKKGIEHAFDIERTLFFGQRHKATTGYMDGIYEQYFTGGLMEGCSTNVQDETGGALTEAELDTWLNKITRYAEKPLIFAGETICEALRYWAKDRVRFSQNEKMYGLYMTDYQTLYGNKVTIMPHRELLQNSYAGYAFAVDMADIKYKFLSGEDTHLVTEIQPTGYKQRIDEYRTWFGLWIGNEKRHGVLKNVGSIA